MRYLRRRARLLPATRPLRPLLRGSCYAVDEVLAPGFRDRSPRTACWAVIYTVSGSSYYRIDRQPVELTPGSLLLLGPGVSFSEYVPGPDPCHNRYLMLEGATSGELARLLPGDAKWTLWPQCPPAVAAALAECVAVATESQACEPWLFTSGLCRLIGALARHNPATRRDSRLADSVRVWLKDNPSEAWRVEQLANEAGMSISAFAHRFRDEAGLSPAAFVRREKAVTAGRLLQSGLSVTETAAQLGFANPYHFSRVFKQIHGVAPRDFKRGGGPSTRKRE
jgi:AraC family transcriptional regulator, arabinose operon regulatory protein